MGAWERIRDLVDKELETVDRRKTFTMDAIGSNSLVVIPTGANPHAVKRAAMERAFEMHRKNPGLTRAQLQSEMPRNRTTSYLLAICQEVAKRSHRSR
jgi:hypothetical protein